MDEATCFRFRGCKHHRVDKWNWDNVNESSEEKKSKFVGILFQVTTKPWQIIFQIPQRLHERRTMLFWQWFRMFHQAYKRAKVISTYRYRNHLPVVLKVDSSVLFDSFHKGFGLSNETKNTQMRFESRTWWAFKWIFLGGCSQRTSCVLQGGVGERGIDCPSQKLWDTFHFSYETNNGEGEVKVSQSNHIRRSLWTAPYHERHVGGHGCKRDNIMQIFLEFKWFSHLQSLLD